MDSSTICGFDFEYTKVKTSGSNSDQWIFSQPMDLASNMQESKQRVPQVTSVFSTTCEFGFENERYNPRTKIHPSIDTTDGFLINTQNLTTPEPKLIVPLGTILNPLNLSKTPNLTKS